MKRFKHVVLCLILMFSCSILGSNSFDAEAASKPYYIKVNKATNVATVYKADGKAYKAFVVSTGSATPTGTFYTPARYRWKELVGPCYGQYCTRITGGILFHSVWYHNNKDKASMSNRAYNNLGTTCSHGCIRLCVRDAKWIYENCPLQTKVIIFSGSSKNDPLGKPTYKPVSTATRMGWDPTDPDSNNPYNIPSISGVSASKTVQVNTVVNICKGVAAKTKQSNITSRMSVSVLAPGSKKAYASKASTMKLSKLGTYTISYYVKDAISGRTASKKVTYKIIDTKALVFTGIKPSKLVQYKSKLDIKTNVRVKNGLGENCTKYMTITVKKPNQTKAAYFYGKTLTFNYKGKYVVTYKSYNPNSKSYTSKTVTYTSGDTQKPKVYGAGAKTVEYGTDFNVKSGVTAKAYLGDNLTSKIKVTAVSPLGAKVTITNNVIKLNKLGVYKLTYSVTNANGISNSGVRKITVVDTKLPIINAPESYTGEAGTTIDLLKDVTAVTAANQKITGSIKVNVVDDENNVVNMTDGKLLLEKKAYTVTYSVTGPNGKSTTVNVGVTVTGIESAAEDEFID